MFHWAVLSVLALASGSFAEDDAEPSLVQSRFVEAGAITAPTGLSVSPEGVVFVSCDPNGVSGVRRGVGEVVRCEDTDGDGKADRFSDFVAGIDSPRGSCYVDGTLYLMQASALVAYRDGDGDGVAEERTVLVTKLGPGLGVRPVVHGANGVRMGIDGWLYLAIGDEGCRGATGTDGSEVTLRGGGVLRVRPDGSQLSVVATGTRNVYDVAVDPLLNLFARDNTNDGGGWDTRLHRLTALADFGYPHRYRNFGHEAMGPLADFGAGAGTGMYYLDEPGFPEGFGKVLYSCDFNTGVAVHRWEDEGLQQEAFMDVAKPTGIDADGMGRLYVSSWSGGGFGGSSRAFGHVDVIQAAERGEVVGYPEIDGAEDEDLLGVLRGASQVARVHAMREIVERGKKAAFSKGLLTLARDGEAALAARVAAVMTLKQLDGVKSHGVLAGLYEDAALRAFVVRALGDVEDEIDGTSRKIAMRALEDEEPRVQLEAVVTLARSGERSEAAAILPLARAETMTGSGGLVSHTALRAVVRLGAIDPLLGKLDDAELREAALRGLQEIHGEAVVKGLVAKVGATRDGELARLITLALLRLYHREAPWDGVSWWGHRPNFAGPYFKGVEWDGTPAVKAGLVAAFNKVDAKAYPELFTQMRRSGVAEGDLELEIAFDEVLSFLDKESLNSAEFTRVMNAVADKARPEEELLKIYKYFKRGPLPESYINRAHILRVWGESDAAGKLQREAYAEFVAGREFIGRMDELRPFFKEDEKECHKYAHLQLLNLLNDASVPKETRDAAAAELEKTWEDKKNIYPHRLRGLMLALEEADPTPYAKQLKPLVDHRDERTKQPAARFLKAIEEGN